MMRALRPLRRFSTARVADDAASGWSISAAGAAAAKPDPTHHVANQSQPLSDYNAYDVALREAVHAGGGEWFDESLARLGAQTGSAEWQQRARVANRSIPELRTHDRFGHRVDVVEYHPHYHELMTLALESGVAALPWGAHRERRGVFSARGALSHMMYQLEQGHGCPTTMTFAAVPALSTTAAVANEWVPKIVDAPSYDGRDGPKSSGVTIGMSMTEKQGGSDVRANTTVATPVGDGGEGSEYTLRGHKWFTSAPMSDAFLTLAHTAEGVSCFLVPRWLPDGSRNAGFRLMRLKEKMGDRSNASSEVEYDNAWARMVGRPGKGVRTIVEMVVHTRLDCVIGSAALMRVCAQHAAAHAAGRAAFGAPLVEQPLMRAVLADLALETEAALASWARLCRSFEAADGTTDASLRRLATAVLKYHVCKRAPGVATEAMECMGGNGYVEDGPLARLYRQAPLNAIWEGSGNVICLDVLRTLAVEPASAAALVDELSATRGADSRYDVHVDRLVAELRAGTAADEPRRARGLVERLAVALQASTLLSSGAPRVAEAFCAARLAPAGTAYGSAGPDLIPAAAEAELIERLRSCERT